MYTYLQKQAPQRIYLLQSSLFGQNALYSTADHIYNRLHINVGSGTTWLISIESSVTVYITIYFNQKQLTFFKAWTADYLAWVDLLRQWGPAGANFY